MTPLESVPGAYTARRSAWRQDFTVGAGDVKAVIEQIATVGYKELNESGKFVILGFAKMSVVNKPATEARRWCKSFHERAHGVRGQASQQVGLGVTPEGC